MSHKHRCPRCNLNWSCECTDPTLHNGYCPACLGAIQRAYEARGPKQHTKTRRER